MLASLKKIFDSCPEPVLITDQKIRIVYVNSAWEKLTKYTFQDVRLQNPRVLKSNRTPKTIYTKLWEALAAGRGFQTEDIVDRRKDGREYSVHSIVYPVFDRGKVRYYIQIQHDITRRRIAEEQKRSLLSVVSHELKTPITTAKFLTEAFRLTLLRKHGQSYATELHDLTLIQQQLARLTRIVDDILNLGRLETHKLHLRTQPTNLLDLITSVIEQLQLSSPHTRIILRGTCHQLVMADNDRLRQVLINLLNNAIKYSPTRRAIRLTIQENPKDIQVSIQDRGPGIARQDQVKIFERYYQVSERTHDGFGLGLYLSKQIIKNHKGKIWVKSKLGEGSTFYFSLPILANAS